jgi:hypothetical protein
VVIAIGEHPELDGLPLHQIIRFVAARIGAEDEAVIVHGQPRNSDCRVNLENDNVTQVIWKCHGPSSQSVRSQFSARDVSQCHVLPVGQPADTTKVGT